ncbi:MAG: hypothetical protein IH596_12815 [Bacteroidales bacterium]|nr:hypothetical protein [Bacteroidales bacterium]
MKTVVVVVLFMISLMPAQAQRRYQLIVSDSQRNAADNRAAAHEWPLVFIAAELQYDDTGTPVLLLLAQNTTMKTIDKYSIKVLCIDEFNQTVAHEKTGNRAFVSKSDEMKQVLWDTYFPDVYLLTGFPKTSRVKVYLTHVQFWDGTSWIPKTPEETLIETALSRSYTVVDN